MPCTSFLDLKATTFFKNNSLFYANFIIGSSPLERPPFPPGANPVVLPKGVNPQLAPSTKKIEILNKLNK
jgi:hypothetical protein